jgi:hypothetical protein
MAVNKIKAGNGLDGAGLGSPTMSGAVGPGGPFKGRTTPQEYTNRKVGGRQVGNDSGPKNGTSGNPGAPKGKTGGMSRKSVGKVGASY